MAHIVRVATRKSKMALFQTNLVMDAIKAAAPSADVTSLPMLSDGCYDKFKGDLKQLGGKGAFIKTLEAAMLAGDAEAAMHSMKDVPTDEDLPEGLIIAAMLPRSDLRDVAICREGETFEGLAKGAKVGTSSARRAAQLRRAFPNLQIVPLRGNADTRIQKLDDGEVDAIMLAKSGVERINLSHRITMVFEPDIMCPAVGQGAVGVECKEENKWLVDLLYNKVNHIPTFHMVMAEREMLKNLNGTCHTPIGGHAEITQSGENMRLIAMVASPDGSEMLWSRQKLPYDGTLQSALAVGRATAEDLKSQGAEAILKKAEDAA